MLDRELVTEMYRRMLRIRRFERQAIELSASGELRGSCHTYIGEEAVAVGACLALRDEDYITGTHRSHGHPIAKGGDLKRAMAELLGKSTGYCKGKGGSMHLADFSIGILGESGIVGSAMPTAIGAALGSKIQGNDRVTVCFFGDGANNTGSFHETINLASVWRLPVIFLCENNQFAIRTPVNKFLPVENIADRACAYNIPGVMVDGQDVFAVHEAVAKAVARARAGEGPTLIEAKTYRFEDHSVSTARAMRAPYRDAEEVDRWKRRDPIELLRERVLTGGVVSEEELIAVDDEVTRAIEEAAKFARESPFPTASELHDDMFADTAPLRW